MSSDQAKSFHSITIGEKNTWDDWHLVPSSRPLVNPPTVKTHYVNLPGADGSIDLTEVLSGKPVYTSRQGSWDFLVINSGQVVYNSNYGVWQERYTEVMSYLHGQKFKVILDDDPGYYYSGRLSVDQWKPGDHNSTITIKYIFEPYKKTINDMADDWLWDPFNFETGVIRTYKNLSINGTTAIDYIITTSIAESPIITTNNKDMYVSFNGVTYPLERGENVINAIQLTEGTNRLIFTGNGLVTINVTGGLL